MKQFKFLAMAIFAMVMSIGFVACSSDDDDDNNGVVALQVARNS